MRFSSKLFMLLSVVVALWSCSSDDDNATSRNQVWQTSLVASKLGCDIENLEEDDTIAPMTRSLFIGGQTGTRFIKLWDDYDVIQVYKDGVYVGTLKPTSTGNLYSTLSGTLEGFYSVGDELTLYMPSPDLDYTGQDGTIGNMSRYFDFMMTTTKVAMAEGSTITTEETKFVSRQNYILLKFRDQDNKLINAKQVIINAASGKLVATKKMDGTTTYTDDLVINTVKETNINDYPTDIYVAMLNDLNAKDSYTFIVYASDGNIYKGKTALSSNFNSKGSMTLARRATICMTIDVGVQTGITPPESDDPDVQQVTL